MSKLTLEVKDFQAIATASIEIEGITVLAGNNSTGKSTLSKLLYYVVKAALEYEVNEYERLFRSQNDIIVRLVSLVNEYGLPLDKNIIKAWQESEMPNSSNIGNNSEIFEAVFFSIKDQFIKWEKESDKIDYKRIRAALSMGALFDSIEELFTMLYSHFEYLREDVFEAVKNRPLDYLDVYLNRYFDTEGVPVHLSEESTPINDVDNNRLNNIYSINKVFYNDTPISISIAKRDKGFNTEFKTHHWDHLRQAIIESADVPLTSDQKEVNNIISDIISGKVSLEDNKFIKSFTYTRSSDNLSIGLADSATGIMSFAIIQLLLSKGLLDDNALLILDEPEAHLHPQWIVEYARVLIIINQKLGVKFMLASHNPDMVSALRYIAEKEGCLESVRFYLSEKVGDDNRYLFCNLGVDIAPIFDSFNIALDRISDYGV